MRTAIAEIDPDALRTNLARVKSLCPGARVLAVVKADGYGHGLLRVAAALAAADGYGVASLDDAARLREAGFRQRIVVLSGFDEARDLPEAAALRAELVLHDDSQLERLGAWRGEQLCAWIKLDTGMHRLGFDCAPASMASLRARLAALAARVDPVVWMTHLACADQPGHPLNALQQRRFATAIDGWSCPTSIANSAGVLLHPATRSGWVRPGGLLYGLSPIAGRSGADLGFVPAMRVKSRIIAAHRVAAGEGIGYGAVAVADRELRVGVVSFGYGDGYPRHAGPSARVRVGARLAPVLGRVSMDLITIDLSGVPEAQVGDEVELWGPGLPAEHLAEAAETIGYELTCGVTRRVRFVEKAVVSRTAEAQGTSVSMTCST